MRADFTADCPHPGPLPQGEGEKHCALIVERASEELFEEPLEQAMMETAEALHKMKHGTQLKGDGA